ncbi:diaminopimelate decarboxylase [Xylophilus ampelinus]|uniref:Diaminopimelate decarboxylase n=1 Tax=Xylophilus ampelinus TaxID=54067 RepID=A0A318SXV0_9BURK|nr:diaminopimelate decarboxylase [Xylophilus ampelinus]
METRGDTAAEEKNYDLSLRYDPALAFKLAPHRHPFVASLLLRHAGLLKELSRGFGSPLHIVFPQIFTENVQRFRRVFAENGLTGTILYAKKANKADTFAQACAQLGIGIDVASIGEFTKALAAGVRGERIGISGPEKTDGLLNLALRHGGLIAIDSLSELRRLAVLAAASGTTARVLLRFRPPGQASSRFGLTATEYRAALECCTSQKGCIRLEGFSFHLSGYSIEKRAEFAGQLIELCLQAQALGFKTCGQIDLGGGLPVQYVDPEQWRRFLQQDAAAHYHAGKTFSGFYPYGAVRHGADALRDLLNCPTGGGTSLAQKARRHGVEFIIEPGRALLDQAGLTLFKVLGVKDRHVGEGYGYGYGYGIVTVQGSSLSLSEQWFNSEYLPDPQLLGAAENEGQVFLACVGGSTCLEGDMLTWRKIGFPAPVQPGDRLVYLNTAGYQMDSNESPFHEAILPSKVVVELHGEPLAPHWHLDGI